MASDGKWYPPHLHPQRTSQPPTSGYPSGPGAINNGGNHDPSSFSGMPGIPSPGPSGGHPGYGFSGPYGYASPPPTWGASGSGYPYPLPQPPTNGLAIASLVCSIVSVFGIGSVLGIIFGCVARGQIRRSRGTQKGGGLALAGIIVGCATLVLALFVVAIPTFLGVTALQAERASVNQSATHLPLAPIVLGQPIEGGQAAPVPWQSKAESGDTTLAAVPGGVTMTIGDQGQVEWATLPIPSIAQSIQLSATVAITAGPQSNGIGLACLTPSQSEQLVFLIHDSGLWQIELLTNQGQSTIDTGFSSVIHPAGSNTLMIACGNDPAKPGSSHLSFEINQTPVANDIADFSFTGWVPAIQLCSCDGPSTGSFRNTAYYGS
jgi:hypothetical protein